MDCVDRDDLIKNLNTFAPECYNALINDLIMKQPTADVVPVRHRRWIIFEIWCGDGKERKYYRCSECYKANAIRSNFCPNCGARMDKESEENNNG